MEGKLKPPAATSQLDADELSLVKNEDYEESMQVTNMVSRVRARAAQSIYTLDQRLALLNNGQKLFEDNNPFGPQAIAGAFRAALTTHPLPLRIKTILYMLFDQHVMHGLDALYDALNRQLIEAGVLPNLKYSAQRAAPQAPKPATPEQPPANPATGEPAAEHPAASNTVDSTSSYPACRNAACNGTAQSGHVQSTAGQSHDAHHGTK